MCSPIMGGALDEPGPLKPIQGLILFCSRDEGHTVSWHISYDGLFLGVIRGESGEGGRGGSLTMSQKT